MPNDQISRKLAFIGLGVMGYPMAGHLSKTGHQVTVYNRNIKRAESWAKDFNGNIAETPAEASKDKDFIFTCVGADNDLREIIFNDSGILSGISTNTIFVDHTTASANIAR